MMTDYPSPSIAVDVDVTNPGQYFACCGLLELIDRIDPGSTGWFDTAGMFNVAVSNRLLHPGEFLRLLADCGLCNTMTEFELSQLKELRAKPKKVQSDSEQAEKKMLESLWRESPLLLGAPFNMRLDWFHDSRSGGSRFKTWAGQQSVIDIASAMLEPVSALAYDEVSTANWLSHPSGHSLTFNFDSDASSQGAALDVGFSLDPLGISSYARPLMELLCFVGMQRFRPLAVSGKNQYIYATWSAPLAPNVSAMVTAGVVNESVSDRFAFPLLYRTKYLKAFLPASPVRDQYEQ